jgi:hypothetical protein
MVAAPHPMVPRSLAVLTWTRMRTILLDSPGGWGRLLASVMAAMWAVSLYANGLSDRWSGTGQMVELLGLHFTVLWMAGVAVLPMIALPIGWLPLRIFSAIMSQITWVWLLFQMATHGHLSHLSAGSCMVGVAACARADVPLWLEFARKYR